MINNRQQSGRRRGRGGQRPQGSGRGPENGNRIDNRARGNAAQLLEKYKTLARDAQQSGDRVLTEYYLQFADHYFRVLAESRARMEENQAQRRPQGNEFANEGQSYDGDDGFEGEDVDEFDVRAQPSPSRPQRDTPPQRDEPSDARRQPRDDRDYRGNNRDDRVGRQMPADQDQEQVTQSASNGRSVDDGQATRVRRELPPRRDRKVEHAEDRFDAGLLPPAIATADIRAEASAVESEPPRPRRGRPRKDATATPPSES